MLVASLLVATAGGLLESNSWNPAGRTGKTAQPDYTAIVTRLTEKVQFDALVEAPSAVVQKAEGSLRQLRAAYRAAPDYAQVATGVLAAANSELAQLGGGLRQAILPLAQDTQEEVVRKAEGGLRQLRAAYRAAPDYAKIASGVLAPLLPSAAEQDDMDDESSVGFDCFGFALQAPDSLRTAVRQIPFWSDPAADASPNYGAIAMAAALDGLKDQESDQLW